MALSSYLDREKTRLDFTHLKNTRMSMGPKAKHLQYPRKLSKIGTGGWELGCSRVLPPSQHVTFLTSVIVLNSAGNGSPAPDENLPCPPRH